jgi:hypothetical protein
MCGDLISIDHSLADELETVMWQPTEMLGPQLGLL